MSWEKPLEAEAFPPELSNLFKDYAAALPDPEPSADFTPGVWHRIELQRSFGTRIRRWFQVFTTTAVATAAVLLVVLVFERPAGLAGTYLEALDNDEQEVHNILVEASYHPSGNAPMGSVPSGRWELQ